MKNQYVGDVGDYGKYGLLRCLADHGIRIAINWYLTPDDGSNDGKHISYLNCETEKNYDRELFETLKTLISQKKRSVLEIEKADMIKNAVYYHEVLSPVYGKTRAEKREERHRWHKKGLEFCNHADLVFLDPDNGLCEGEPSGSRESCKYVYAAEAADYYRMGKNVMYYCQKGRRTWQQWDETKNIMSRMLPEAVLCAVTFHRGTQRTYVFVLHKEDYQKYYKILTRFLRTRWGNVFSAEPVGDSDWQCRKTGEKLDIALPDGTVMMIETTEGGDVMIRFSDKINTSLRMEAEQFASYFRR